MIELRTPVFTKLQLPIATSSLGSHKWLQAGELIDLPENLKQLTNGVSLLEVTPNTTGRLYLINEDEVLAQVVVEDHDSTETLDKVRSALLGSWHWNKVDNTLVLYTENGEVLTEYKLTETSDSASRELVS